MNKKNLDQGGRRIVLKLDVKGNLTRNEHTIITAKLKNVAREIDDLLRN